MSRRRAPVHLPQIERFGRATIVLVTVCTYQRKRILACSDGFELLVSTWRRVDDWKVGRFVVLPDHAHLFCAPAASARPLARWISHWKSVIARCWPRPDEQPLWQRDFWDRQLRNSEHYDERWEYVRGNPVRHGLATSPLAWHYQGELNRLQL